jgi:hypothetical protein
MKWFFIITGFLLFVNTNAFSQDKYYTKTGTLNFEASVPSFEEVKAKNNTTTAILNIETGEIAALSLIKGFRFKVALMEEHFNESYAESNKFPKATFSGKIQNYKPELLTKDSSKFLINGKLTFHGKTIEIITDVFISMNNNIIKFNSTFKVKPEDFDIQLPKVVRYKIAEIVDVQIYFELNQKK